MSRYLIAACAVLALSGCVAVHADVRTDAVANPMLTAQPNDCPADRTQANARSSSPGGLERVGAVEVEVTRSPLIAPFEGHALRMRRLTIQPGGSLPWHSHDARQGIAIVLSGDLVEYRNNCLDPIHHDAGDMVREVVGLSHGWRNESDQPAVILATDILAPAPR